MNLKIKNEANFTNINIFVCDEKVKAEISSKDMIWNVGLEKIVCPNSFLIDNDLYSYRKWEKGYMCNLQYSL